MYRARIQLRPEAPNHPLHPLWVGQGGAAFVILSNVPDEATPRLIITPVGSGTPVAYEATKNQSTGEWGVYVAGWGFPTVGDTSYEVTIKTREGDDARTFWAGRGDMHVWRAATVADIPTAPAIIPPDSFARHPGTGLYYRILAATNELGEIVFTASQEGVDHV